MDKIKDFYDYRIKRGGRHAALGVLLLVLLLFCFPAKGYAKTKIKGIDVSRWQGTIDWEKVKEDGIAFVMLGTGRYQSPDPNFKYNIEQAIAQDIPVGIYLYSKATSPDGARQEALYVLEQIDGYKISYPIAFDLEDQVHRSLSTSQRTEIALAFLEIIEQAGYYPMLYASEDWFTCYLDTSQLDKYDKWVARYASSTSIDSPGIWQYSCTGKVKGISVNVDLNYAYRDYSKLIAPRTKAKSVSLPQSDAGWNTDGTNYWYVLSDGSRVRNTFKTIGGKTYYFDVYGHRLYGWQQIDGNYYYFREKDGVMKKGWLNLNGSYYYLGSDGVRRTGWITVKGKRYYLNADGVRQYKWLTLNGKKYWLRKTNGSLKKGWMTMPGGSVYYFDKTSGEMAVGWQQINGKTYYFKKNGKRASGWKKLNGRWYYFKPSSGVMQKNCTIDGYTLGADGACINR